MSIIINILLTIAALVSAIWLLWNLLEVAYHIVMIVFYAIAYAIVSIFEAAAFVIKWTILKPVIGLMRVCKR